jgi:hypothetical protein
MTFCLAMPPKDGRVGRTAVSKWTGNGPRASCVISQANVTPKNRAALFPVEPARDHQSTEPSWSEFGRVVRARPNAIGSLKRLRAHAVAWRSVQASCYEFTKLRRYADLCRRRIAGRREQFRQEGLARLRPRVYPGRTHKPQLRASAGRQPRACATKPVGCHGVLLCARRRSPLRVSGARHPPAWEGDRQPPLARRRAEARANVRRATTNGCGPKFCDSLVTR